MDYHRFREDFPGSVFFIKGHGIWKSLFNVLCTLCGNQL